MIHRIRYFRRTSLSLLRLQIQDIPRCRLRKIALECRRRHRLCHPYRTVLPWESTDRRFTYYNYMSMCVSRKKKNSISLARKDNRFPTYLAASTLSFATFSDALTHALTAGLPAHARRGAWKHRRAGLRADAWSSAWSCKAVLLAQFLVITRRLQLRTSGPLALSLAEGNFLAFALPYPRWLKGD